MRTIEPSKLFSGPSRLATNRLLAKLGKHPKLVLNGAALALRVGRDYKRMRDGALERGEFRARTSGHVIGITLGMGGATAGATIGSVIPGIGTILGGFAGGLIGDYAGTQLGEQAARKLEERIKTGKNPT